MSGQCRDIPERVDGRLVGLIDRYRDTYLRFFLDRFDPERAATYRGGFFNINSVTGRPYDHNLCFSWTDGRALGELVAARVAAMGDSRAIDAYTDHLFDVLAERYDRNGYFPHVVVDSTNVAADHPMNVRIGRGESSFSHVFVMNGFLQYGLARQRPEAWERGEALLADLESALRTDRFLEGAEPRPEGQRAQGPFMITLGAVTDVLETLATLAGRDSKAFANRSTRLIDLGRSCVGYILANHHRPADDAFWEVSVGGEAVSNAEGRVVTDPGHTIEFTGFAARFAASLDGKASESLRRTVRGIFRWATSAGFHPTRDLIYKNVDRDTGRPIQDQPVDEIEGKVAPEVFRVYFGGRSGPARVATFPWWVPMELLAAGSILRQRDDSGDVDRSVLRAARGLFSYYPNERIGGLCYQNIADGCFDYIDVPPATASLDLMHSHRSMRIFVREVAGPDRAPNA